MAGTVDAGFVPANYTPDGSAVDANSDANADTAHLLGIDNALGALSASSPYTCRVTHSTATTLTTAVPAVLAFDAERHDTGAMHDTVTNNSRITIQVPGTHLVGGTIAWENVAAAGSRRIELRLNGTDIIAEDEHEVAASDDIVTSIMTLYEFAKDDYVELLVTQDSGGDVDVLKSGGSDKVSPEFWAVFMPNRTDPKGFIDGCQVVYNSISTVDIAVGETRDVDDIVTMVVASTLTADITAGGANGLDTGAEAADTWYSVWVIAKADGTVASLLSLSATAPTMPATYLYKRRVGWVFNNGTDIRNFTSPDEGRTIFVQWDSDETDLRVINGTSDRSWTDVDCSAQAPSTAHRVLLRVATSTSTVVWGGFRKNGASDYQAYYGRRNNCQVDCDTSQLIEYQEDSGNGTFVRVAGYWEVR
jgi:hypothetical protein